MNSNKNRSDSIGKTTRTIAVCANVDLAMVCELVNTPWLKQVGVWLF